MREALCTLHNIGCSAHCLRQSSPDLFFFLWQHRALGHCKSGFHLREQHYGSTSVCTCVLVGVCVCVFVCRLMTTGIRNATD